MEDVGSTGGLAKGYLGRGTIMAIKMDLNQFMADVCDTIGEMGVWPAFLRAMGEKGYSEKQVDSGFDEIVKKR